MHAHTLARDWVRAGNIALACLFVLIVLLRFTPAPPVVDRFGAFIGSALPAVVGLGLYALLRLHRETVTLRLAVLSAIMLAFATVLQTIIQHMGASVPAEAQAVIGPAQPEAVTATLAALVVVLRMAKGIFSPIMLFLFSLNMLRHPLVGEAHQEAAADAAAWLPTTRSSRGAVTRRMGHRPSRLAAGRHLAMPLLV